MGTDLEIFYSHPDKLLEVHINGVLKKTQKRTTLKMAELAVLFHDLGKINPNFQKKLNHANKGSYLGYSGHSYLSSFAFLCFLEKNQQQIKELLNVSDSTSLKLEVLRIIAIIAHHHGNLPDLDKNLKDDPKKEMLSFVSKREQYLPISAFYECKLGKQHSYFDLNVSVNPNKHCFFKLAYFEEKEAKRWKESALMNFLDTQFVFASLIEADKRDAGYNENYFFEEAIKESIVELQSSLKSVFSGLAPETPLNKLRTQIRKEAIIGLVNGLERGKRVFSLTAPTGAGKTFTLLALASEIQKRHADFGILYALPFLSITEQVEQICRKKIVNGIQKGLIEEVLSVNSKAVNERIQCIQAELETNQNEENLDSLLEEDFIGQSFDNPFIITTFVQFFETLVSNRNATLLKLPNFSKRVFLIDEVQALPPRLYIFFAGWLQEFCKRYNAYAIFSTATMPHFSIKEKEYLDEYKRPDLLFKGFEEPSQILEAKKFFKEDVFNRYCINLIDEDAYSIEQLSNHINLQTQSVLVILNTIKDTKLLYNYLKGKQHVYLLNTHFTPADRRAKIKIVNEHLKDNENVILISTQLIEAGVDIDFPIVYRDLCPLPSLIQSAGRCNRNRQLSGLGTVYFFHLDKGDGKSSAIKVYRNEAKQFLEFCKTNIQHGVEEKDLFEIQERFFKKIADDLTVGEVDREFNMIECVNKAQFEKLDRFKLINKKTFGEEYQYYIPNDERDQEYYKAVDLMKQMKAAKDKGYKFSKRYKIDLHEQLRKLADRMITLRAFDNTNIPLPANNPEYFDIKVLADLSLYSFEEGLIHNSTENSCL